MLPEGPAIRPERFFRGGCYLDEVIPKIGSNNMGCLHMRDGTKHERLNRKKWDSWADTLDEKNWRNEYLRDAQRRLINLLDARENLHFLDIGCGAGWAVSEVARLAGFKGQFYGVDLSAKMIEKADRNAARRENLHFLQANAESIPLQDHFFDTIICTNSFHHYLHPDRALEEMCRLLKTGGKVFVLDPTADTVLMKIADRIIKLFEPTHVKMYSTGEFQRMFERAHLRYETSLPVKKRSKVHIGVK